MKKRILSALLCMALLVSLATGCGGSPAPAPAAPAVPAAPADPTSPATPAAPVNIVWAGWSGEEEASKDIFTKMRQSYEQKSGNTVTWVGWTWADTAQQILIRSQGQEQLDVAQVDIGIFNTLAQAGILADVSQIVGADYLSSTFQQSALEVGNVDGKQLALPWSMASISTVYNPELLKKAGWEKPPVTIEEFEKCLADVKALGGDIIPYAVSTKDATCAGDFMPWLWTFGGSIFDEAGNVTLDSPAAVECVKWYQKLLANGYIAMDTGRGEARQLFAQGKVAFYDDAVVAKGQAVNNGVAPDQVVNVCSAIERPVLKVGDKPQSTMWGHMLVVFENSKQKEVAAEFAKSLVSDEIALEYFEKNGMPPVTNSATATDVVKNDPYLNGFIQSTATARLEETARMANASEIKTVITEELQFALLGQKTAEQCIQEAAARLKAL